MIANQFSNLINYWVFPPWMHLLEKFTLIYFFYSSFYFHDIFFSFFFTELGKKATTTIIFIFPLIFISFKLKNVYLLCLWFLFFFFCFSYCCCYCLPSLRHPKNILLFFLYLFLNPLWNFPQNVSKTFSNSKSFSFKILY